MDGNGDGERAVEPAVKRETPRELKWPARALWTVRGAAGVAAILVVPFTSLTRMLVVKGTTKRYVSDQPLRWAVLLLGVFILAHLALEWIIIRLPKGSAQKDVPTPNPFAATANALVTTPAVVLGLLAAFGTSGTLTTVVKVGAGALVAALLLSIIVGGLTSMSDVDQPPRSTAIRLCFNLTLWALALGLLGITMGLIYRT